MKSSIVTLTLLALLSIGCSTHRTSVDSGITGEELDVMLNSVIPGGSAQSVGDSVFKDEYATIYMSTSEGEAFGSAYSVLSFYNLSDLGFQASFDQLTNARVLLAELNLSGEARRAELAISIQTQAEGSYQTKRFAQVGDVKINKDSWEVDVSDGQVNLKLISYSLKFQSTQLDSAIKVEVYREGQYIGKFPTLAGYFK